MAPVGFWNAGGTGLRPEGARGVGRGVSRELLCSASLAAGPERSSQSSPPHSPSSDPPHPPHRPAPSVCKPRFLSAPPQAWPPQSFLWTHFLFTSLWSHWPSCRPSFCLRALVPCSPQLGTLFSKCLNGWLPSPHLLYSGVTFPTWPSLTTLLIIIAASIPTLFSLIAFIATRSANVYSVHLPCQSPGSLRTSACVFCLFPLNPGRVRAQQAFAAGGRLSLYLWCHHML